MIKWTDVQSLDESLSSCAIALHKLRLLTADLPDNQDAAAEQIAHAVEYAKEIVRTGERLTASSEGCELSKAEQDILNTWQSDIVHDFGATA